MLTISYIQDFLASHSEIIYSLITLGVIIEGEIVVIIGGILAHLGSVNIFLVFWVTILGGIIKSIIGYSLGYYLQKKHSENCFLITVERRINSFFPRFTEKPFLSIFLSRFLIFGLYWFGLIYAGYKKINLRTFIKAEISSLFTWTVVMLCLGWFFSHTALSISHNIRNFLGVIFLFFIVFFILEKITSFFIKFFKFEEINN
jgi:membrane protein DedA with SNARE-associated domain